MCTLISVVKCTGVFNPLKLTDRTVIIGSLLLLHVTALILILLQKLLYHKSKQCRQLSDIFSFITCLVSTLDLHCLSNSFIWVLGFIRLTDCVQIMMKCIFFCAEGLRICQQSFSHTCIGTFHEFLDGTSSKQNI